MFFVLKETEGKIKALFKVIGFWSSWNFSSHDQGKSLLMLLDIFSCEYKNWARSLLHKEPLYHGLIFSLSFSAPV